jgi:hypothetical protein
LGYISGTRPLGTDVFIIAFSNRKACRGTGEVEEDSDRFSIQVGHRYFGILAYENCDSFTRELCDGFAEGVNAWILEIARNSRNG